MNTKPTVSRYVERDKITVPPNTRAKADEEGITYKFTIISIGHYACESIKDAHIIIDKGGKIGCSCGDMTYRCTGTNVCKHIAALLDLKGSPQIPASGELIKKLILMGWVGGRDDLHPAELLKPAPIGQHVAELVSVECPHCKTWAKRETQEEADAWLVNHLAECPENSVNTSLCPLHEPEETTVPAKAPKVYTHTDGTEFSTAEAMLDYADGIKDAQEMEDTKALMTPSSANPIVAQNWSDEQIEVMKRTVAEKATPAEFAYFMEVARCSGLNPFLREIYFMKTDKGQTAIITGRDGLLTIAKRDRRFKSIQSMDVCEKDEFEMAYSNGVMEVTKHLIKDFRDRGNIIGAWARGEMDGETPVTAYASIKEYDKGSNIWKTYKSAMIKKVPESMVLKRIAGISGLVTEAEISESETFVVDAEET
jgi:hypothetical protein